MCGIAGSTDKDRAYKLYKDNLNRGFYSSGSMLLDDTGVQAYKKVLGDFKTPFSSNNYTKIYYLYHSRGPTVETKGFEEDNNHPFFYKDWAVAHNGIISNFEKLTKQHYPEEDFAGKTDSCIIPRMLDVFGIENGPEKLEGTFAFWAFNTRTKNLYLVRNSCTLFVNWITGDFSSTEFENSEPLEEKMLFNIKYNNLYTRDAKIKYIKSYNFNSPYFIL
jgi:glucosamine 6-phosphate synthetase-like amidotransferase/phosphosugar isomerase protein